MAAKHEKKKKKKESGKLAFSKAPTRWFSYADICTLTKRGKQGEKSRIRKLRKNWTLFRGEKKASSWNLRSSFQI